MIRTSRCVTPFKLLTLLAVLAALFTLADPARSQQDESPPATRPAPTGIDEAIPTIRIEGNARRKIPIAIPDLRYDINGGRGEGIAETIRVVVRDDLDFSGYFHIVPEEYHDLIEGGGSRRVNYKEWLGIGAEALLLGRVEVEPSTVVFEGRVYDTTEKRMVLGKRYRGGLDLQRLVAHKLSNEIIRQYTGQTGVAMTKIAFVSQVGRAREIHVMDYDGARVKRLTANGTINLSPAWSPDGSRIAFVSYRRDSPELVILNQKGELEQTFPQHGELNSAPAWAPDGRHLAFSSSRDGNAEIYTLRIMDKSLTRLTRNPGIDTSPTWSPNGREIAFTSDRAGRPQIYIMEAEGTNVRRLTFEVSYCDAASWSPLGDRIAFTARVPGGFDIFVKNLDTGELHQLTRNSNINEWPRWSPDGRHIAFASNRTGSFDVYTMSFDGSRQRRLTRGGNSFSPSWS
ncbi:MAG: Tol-Pal system beta propeller repeat protein TolB, partial [Acidobacteria bacterium]|nr:Tol-Pal system beta propeller repeat protein TolB [Acidobacteriota bacterium]